VQADGRVIFRLDGRLCFPKGDLVTYPASSWIVDVEYILSSFHRKRVPKTSRSVFVLLVSCLKETLRLSIVMRHSLLLPWIRVFSRNPSSGSWAPGRLLLLTSSCSKSANKLDKCSFGFLTHPEIKTMKHILKPEVTAQIINRCLSHHIS